MSLLLIKTSETYLTWMGKKLRVFSQQSIWKLGAFFLIELMNGHRKTLWCWVVMVVGYTKGIYNRLALNMCLTGAVAERVHLHPSIFGNRCMHLSFFRLDTSFPVFSSNVSCKLSNLHPSIKISNKGPEY